MSNLSTHSLYQKIDLGFKYNSILTLRMATAKANKLTKVMEGLGIKNESELGDFKYAGGDKGRHKNYYVLVYGAKEPPPHTSNCVCGHSIYENCYVANKQNELFVVGNCCIKQFIAISGRSCAKCDKPHKNRSDNFCNTCRIIAKGDELIRFNKSDINQCAECGIDCGKYKRCYSCKNFGVPSNVCGCGKNCGTWERCWDCFHKRID